jgi:hypothetical protein
MKYIKLYEQYTGKSYTDFNIIKELGSGQNGTVYLMDNHQVLKITDNEAEYESTEYAMECGLKYIPAIYEVGTLDSGEYYIVREYVELLSDEQQEQIEVLYDLLSVYFEKDDMTDIFFFEDVQHPHPLFSETLPTHLQELYGNISTVFNHFKQYNFTLTDITLDCFGTIRGNLVVFDLL